MPRSLAALAPALRALAALALGLALVAGICGSELGRFHEALPGYDNTDHAGAVYLHAQFHQRVFDGELPGFDPNQLYPTGTWLAGLHGGNSLEMLVSLALRYVLPWPAWFSWAHFAWIPLNVLAFLPLGRFLWGRTGPALAAGAAWAILPLHLGEIYAGRMTQVALVGLPIGIWGLLRVCEAGPDPAARKRAAALAGAGMALTALGYWFYGLFLGLLLPIFAAWGWRARRDDRRDLARDLLIACGVAALLAGPFLLPVLGPKLLGQWTPAPPIDPSNANPVFDNALQLMGEQPVQLEGWLPWVLVPGWLYTLVKGQRRALWFGAGIFCLICAMGPAQRLGDRVWHLPYELLWRGVPFLDRLTHPSRWLGVGGIFLVIAAADGAARGPLRGALTWLLPAGVMAHLYAVGLAPPGHWRQELPPVWSQVATQVDGAVIVVPVLNAPHTCRWQPFHGKPLLGGMVEHLPWAWPPEFREMVEGNALLMGMYALGWNRDQVPPTYQADLDQLRELGFDAVVLDREAWRFLPMPTSLNPEARLREALGEPMFADESGVLWRLPDSGTPGDPPPPVMALPPP